MAWAKRAVNLCQGGVALPLCVSGKSPIETGCFGSGGAGTVFALNTNASGITNLYSFTAVEPFTLTYRDEASPQAGLILSGNTLYGTGFRGGNSTLGTVYALNTNGTGFTVLHGFTVETYDSNFNLTNRDGANPRSGLIFSDNMIYRTASQGCAGGNGTVLSLSLLPAPRLTLLGITLSGTNLAVHGVNGLSGETNVTLINPHSSTPLNLWTPVATNILNVTGDFTFTATNAVNPNAPRGFYILRNQ